jgi:NAD+ kinase
MRFAFVASNTPVAQQARDALVQRYGDVPPGQAELIVALGGDGFMLRTLHAYRDLDVPVYGMKLGQVGFLMNMHRLDGWPNASSARTWPRCFRFRCG